MTQYTQQTTHPPWPYIQKWEWDLRGVLQIPWSPFTILLYMYCPIPATASTLNSVLMRNHELWEGIEVVDDEGNVVGTSVIAARRVIRA